LRRLIPQSPVLAYAKEDVVPEFNISSGAKRDIVTASEAVLKEFIRQLCINAAAVTRHSGRKTISQTDIEFVLSELYTKLGLEEQYRAKIREAFKETV
jgi:histone H3/H4